MLILSKLSKNAICDIFNFNITQTEIGEKCGLTRSYVNKIIKGKENHPDTLARIETAIAEIANGRKR